MYRHYIIYYIACLEVNRKIRIFGADGSAATPVITAVMT